MHAQRQAPLHKQSRSRSVWRQKPRPFLSIHFAFFNLRRIGLADHRLSLTLSLYCLNCIAGTISSGIQSQM